jgi:hypothetical protein
MSGDISLSIDTANIGTNALLSGDESPDGTLPMATNCSRTVQNSSRETHLGQQKSPSTLVHLAKVLVLRW